MERWPLVLDLLKNNIGEHNFSKWIKPTRLLSGDGDNFVLEVPNRYIMDQIQNTFDSPLKSTIATVYHKPEVALSIVLAKETPLPPSRPLPNIAPAVDSNNNNKNKSLNPLYSFANFIVGGSNQFANAAAMAVADAPGTAYNPLFIYGGVGLGKTHLLNAIGLTIGQHSPQLKICYLNSERFINDLINCLRLKKMDDFRNRYRMNCDVLLIDDIQFIAGKERSQEEFFHTFNTLYESKKQIVLTSDKVPKDIPDLEDRLRSRFEWGLIADIQPPELETRIAIIKKKAEAMQIDLADEVSHFIAGSINSHVRELEGSLLRLSAFASLTGQSISLDLAKEAFKNMIKPPKLIDVDEIQKGVARAFNIKPADLCSSRKFKYIALPRQIAMYLSRKLTACSFPDIGNKFGGKDHTTVLHAVRKIERLIISDNSLKNTVESLEKTLKFGVN